MLIKTQILNLEFVNLQYQGIEMKTKYNNYIVNLSESSIQLKLGVISNSDEFWVFKQE
jgi:hypothetical protein